MIVTCPNCGARYRIPDAAASARMRCAECQHRWVPRETQAELAVEAPEATPVAAPPPIEPTDEPPVERDAEQPRPRILATIAAVVTGAALLAVAAGLWVDDATREQLAGVPGLGDALAIVSPAPSPLKVKLVGSVARLPGGGRVLEVSGTITNPTAAIRKVAPLAARLSGPAGVALRWIIPVPVAQLAPGQSASFTSTVTGFPAEATQLSITPG